MMTGVNMVHVPYRGNAPALTDLIAGQVQMMFADTPSSIEHVKAGKFRALAVTTTVRSEILPEVPTVSEFLPGFEAGNWFGIAAPGDTPLEIIDKLNNEINVALADPKSRRGSRIWVRRRLRARPPISENSSLRKPRSGAR